MRIFNLSRGAGKTMRMMFASEFNNAPILCSNYKTKDYILNMAKRYGLNIPEPITARELYSGYVKNALDNHMINDILIDEPLCVLQELLQSINNNLHIVGCALSDEEKQKLLKEID